jgi:hypothetical protein
VQVVQLVQQEVDLEQVMQLKVVTQFFQQLLQQVEEKDMEDVLLIKTHQMLLMVVQAVV